MTVVQVSNCEGDALNRVCWSGRKENDDRRNVECRTFEIKTCFILSESDTTSEATFVPEWPMIFLFKGQTLFKDKRRNS